MQALIEFEKKPLLFSNPQGIIACYQRAEVPTSFEQLEKALADGYYLAGFFSYELGYAFEERLFEDKTFSFPLIYFGLFKQPEKPAPREAAADIPGKIEAAKLNISISDYTANINAIREYIANGDVYQITYCLKYLFNFQGDPYDLYKRLKHEQAVPYPAFIETDKFKILSLSPEMFIKKSGEYITTKPMKGTWWRRYLDYLAGGWKLKYDQKNRAENVMIADLLRNDLGRIGQNIKAPKLFEVDRYRTLYQMTSTVTGKVEREIPLYELFKAIHPSGSVTGAPKIRAMQIIKELEREERRIYTGAIGYITPQRKMFFNVPIRTLLIRNGQGEMGVGGGIVWDSTPAGEFAECQLKAKFLLDRQ
jgi:para-aminobenzoate synthetase/4-amino-4-deoxychorismate lyase